MTQSAYVAELLRLYLEAPDTPRRPSPHDRRLAAELHRQGVSLDHLAHAIRLATLRRLHRPHSPIYSLAYYRAVLERLTDDELETGYVDYVCDAHRRRCLRSEQRPDSQEAALSRRR